MGLVYVVADEQCVLVFGCSRHTDSSYRFGFLPVGPSAPSPVVYNTVRGTVEAAAPRPARVARGSDTARGSNAVSSTTTRSRGSDTRPRCFHELPPVLHDVSRYVDTT
jgi:hypothetical protein